MYEACGLAFLFVVIQQRLLPTAGADECRYGAGRGQVWRGFDRSRPQLNVDVACVEMQIRHDFEQVNPSRGLRTFRKWAAGYQLSSITLQTSVQLHLQLGLDLSNANKRLQTALARWFPPIVPTNKQIQKFQSCVYTPTCMLMDEETENPSLIFFSKIWAAFLTV